MLYNRMSDQNINGEEITETLQCQEQLWIITNLIMLKYMDFELPPAMLELFELLDFGERSWLCLRIGRFQHSQLLRNCGYCVKHI